MRAVGDRAAFFTMFTVITMENWVDLVRLNLAYAGVVDVGAAIFFITFILIVVWTMLPVAVPSAFCFFWLVLVGVCVFHRGGICASGVPAVTACRVPHHPRRMIRIIAALFNLIANPRTPNSNRPLTPLTPKPTLRSWWRSCWTTSRWRRRRRSR